MIKKEKTINKRKISYYHYKSNSKISILFCPGFNSDMNGNKAKNIYKWCTINNIECLLFDYSGHGTSEGRLLDLGIEEWTEEANFLLNSILKKPSIVIGSSMGGWIAINLALKNPSKVCAVLGIATAPDFTEKLWKKILSKKQKANITKYGHINIQSDYNQDGYIISKKLINSGKKFLITNRKKIQLHCPVRLIHGSDDKEVNLNNSIEIFNKINAKDVELIIIKNGDHRLSSPNNLKTIVSTLQSLVERILV